MRKNNKLSLLIVGIIFVISFYLKLNPGYLVSSDFKMRMYNDFKSFKEETENLNEKFASIIIADEYELNKLVFNSEVLNNFIKSKNNAARIGEYNISYEYDDVYRRYNENIKYILEDGFINETEQLYINALYNYNDEIVQEFDNLLGLKSKNENNQTKKTYKNIVNDYKEFSAVANEILNTENYSILKVYRGDFSEFDLERAEKFIKEVFSKVVPGRALKYNNTDDKYDDKLVFATYEKKDDFDTSVAFITPQYQIEYNKRTRAVYLRLVGRIIPTYVLKEDEVDSIAQEIVTKLNYNGALNERTISNFSIPQLSSIRYSYIYKTDDIWDKQKDMELELDSFGLVRELSIADSDYNIKLDFTDINEIIKLIEKRASINDIAKIRNVNGELEYIVNIDFKGTNYDMVIDGVTGEFKSSYRNIIDK